MSFVAALLPVLVYIFVVFELDSFSFLSVKKLFLLVGCGMLAALFCYGLFWVLDFFVPVKVSDFLYPLLEELIKPLPLLILARKKKIVFFIDSVICGAAVGGGFAILENIFYLVLGEPLALGTVLFRSLEVSLIHMGCTALMSASFMFVVRLEERFKAKLPVKKADIAMAVLLSVAPPIIHACHNALHFNPVIQFAFVFAVMAGLLVWTYQYDGDMIHRWLDRGLDKQVSLLQAIKEGHLGDTKTGEFLMSVKETFPPEVFFDIICYVQLNIELSVAAKSRFMMREAGLDIPLDPEQKETYLAQYKEFMILEKQLDKVARMTIAPVVKFYPADRKALDDLLAECKVS
jgi:RsiW-degrading membrane proteinase PrsW (M82 family)